MKKYRKYWIVSCLVVVLFATLLLSCHQQNNSKQDVKINTMVDSNETRYRDILLSFFSVQDFKDKSTGKRKRDELLKEDGFKESSYNWMFLAYHYYLNRKLDSISYALKQLDHDKLSPDLISLKDYFKIRAEFSFNDVTDGAMMERLINAKEYALKNKSVFTFLFYNMLANADYNREDYRKALENTNSWYAHHPNRSDVYICQAYHEIKFMQYIGLHDKKELRKTLDSCIYYANKTQDSAVIMRMHNLESQYFFNQGNSEKAVESSRRYFNYLVTSKTLNPTAYANFAKNFLNNNQVDSAIFYFNAGLEFIEENKIKYNTLFFYKNLQGAYASKGDYKNAYTALDSTFAVYKSSLMRIQTEKLQEINAKYQTEKKDQAIDLLKTTNAFNHKILVQQRWMFVILLGFLLSVVIFLYYRNKQKLLKSTHEKIIAENKQLLLEQKTRQNQLNPHFIYNAISNLQGLISSEQKTKANQYLILLSRQIRDILELNREEYISLEQEIKSLKNYMLLQQMRYQDVFDFHMDTHDLDLENVMIPPMLIQPFVENAIEYGFKNLSYMGNLQIDFYEKENHLYVSICDNGLGLQSKKEGSQHKKSLSQVITKERLDLLYPNPDQKAGIEIIPNYKEDESGYRIVIYIPLNLYFN
ncbi:histidine kinase [Sphingobacterium sp. SRCM116780]|uniref:sensor histidine kinase n=1 Tax=Sphingobacterium sp. SRCM116780 TaxID=2907623 RepID=UPI001F18BC33|nr:histidine kinase [Sphingobacterium sp. SRCM116780]UIR57288.1 histidine kinase [Sphingobacterium sp. SRCM116780]